MPVGSSNNTFTFTAASSITEDLGVTGIGSFEYTNIPLDQVQLLTLGGAIQNNGNANLTDVVLTANVYLGAALQQTTSSAAGTVNIGATGTFTTGTYTPTAVGNYTVDFIASSATITDQLATNDTMTFQFVVGNSMYSRDDGNQTGSLGIGTGAATNGRIGQNFDVATAASVDSVLVYITNGGATGNTMVGQPVTVSVYSTTASEPNAVVGTSSTVTISAVGGQWVNLAFGSLVLNPGEYFFGVHEADSNLTLGTSAAIFTTGKGWVEWTGNTNATAPWSNSEDFAFNVAYLVRPYLSTTSGTEDLSVTASNNEYTMMPFDEANGMSVNVTISNNGQSPATDAIVQTDVFLLPNTTTPVQQLTSSAQSVAVGATMPVAVGNFIPTVNGDYVFVHSISSILLTDVISNNDTIANLINVDATFARDNDNWAGGSLGIGAGAAAGGFIGQNYTFANVTSVDSVFVFIANGAAGNVMVGQPLSVSIYSTSTSTPNVSIGTTDTVTVTTTGPHWVALPLSGGMMNLAAGEYFFGAVESDSNLTIGTTAGIFTTGKGWVTWAGNPNGAGTWSNSEDFNFNVAYMLRAHVSTCPVLTNTNVLTTAGCGLSDGTATATPAGGTGTYTYMWDAAAANQVTAMAAGLAAGTYVVTFADANGCFGTDTVTIINPNVPTASAAVTSAFNGADVSCMGSIDGEATAAATGGTGAYTYMWDAAAANQATAIAVGLAAGTYNVTVTDASNCESTSSVTVGDAPAITAVLDTVINVLCNGDATGEIMLTITGGTGALIYSWDNGATTLDITGLVAGTYSGTVTDANGCIIVGGGVVTEPAAALAATATDNANGSATAAATGGTSAYTYMWDAAAGSQTTATATALVPGNYDCTVTDANGCTSVASVSIILALNNIAGLNNLNMFPNPTNANVFVELDLTESKDVVIRVTNVMGQTVLANNVGTIQSERVELKTADLPSGVYMVQFTIGTETISRKLVVNKQ